jgi:hypothetical protein
MRPYTLAQLLDLRPTTTDKSTVDQINAKILAILNSSGKKPGHTLSNS